MKRDRALETKVGLFVLIGLAGLILIVFLLGAERHVFDRKVELVAYFEEIEGLKAGAPVLLAGVEVGLVDDISFGATVKDPRIKVVLSVRRAVFERIRQDSSATIGSRGLLGDKLVQIHMGSPDQPPLQPGGEIRTKPAADMAAMMVKANEVLDNVVEVSKAAKKIADSFAGSPIEDDATNLVQNLGKLAEDIRTGDGLIHSLIYGDQYETRLMRTLDDVSASAASVRVAVERVDGMLARAEKGPGALHAILYDPAGEQMLSALSRAASEIELIIHAARTEDGTIRQLIYGTPGQDPLGDLSHAAADLREITRRIRAGEGTIGGLLRDPTIYEDLKLTLSEVRRNTALKAVLRFAIEARDTEPAPPPRVLTAP